jgi:radical SAM superfamily enzyme YgiQ (UPF0313 family)
LDAFTNSIRKYLDNETQLGISGGTGVIQACLVYPNTYTLGIANLGFNRVWQLLDREPNFVVERAFLFEPPQRAEPKSWESKRPFGAFHLLAFSVSSEEDYPAILEFLITSGIPPRAAKRTLHDPIIIMGGLAPTLNPLPLSLYMDAIFLGDGELLIPALGRAIEKSGTPWDRNGVLDALSSIPGVWVPTKSEPNITIANWKLSLSLGPARSMALSPDGHFGSMFLIEVGRGCGRLCRYCATCYSVPHRIWFSDVIVHTVTRWIDPPGPVGLVGAALSDHPDLPKIVEKIVEKGYRLGLSSFRADILDKEFLQLLRRAQVETITIAPEAGSEQLRARIGKPIADSRILETARWVAEVGFPHLRCYFMTGLPNEIPEDIEAIVLLCRRMYSAMKAVGSPPRLDIRVTPFVPKPGTPFQWAPFALETALKKSHQRIRSTLENQPGITLRITSPSEAWREALFSRGDARIGMAIEDVLLTGKSLRQSALQVGLDLKTISQPWLETNPFPWHHIHRHIATDFVEHQWKMSQR